MSSGSTWAHGDYGWWREARFGMFIHWGLYAVPGRHEWIQSREKIPPEVYARYQDYFSPDLFEPREWARLARQAGMKYLVFTAKHHEGFCMWDTRCTDYKVRRDYLREVLDAYRAEGLRVGIYYSLIDWHHPDFVIDVNHPLFGHPERDAMNRQRSQKRYAAYMREQVTELLTQYGRIDVLWFDYSYPREDGFGKGHADWESAELLQLVRRLQPDVLVDDRLDLPGAGDFISPEQYVPANGIRSPGGELLPWEGCQTFSGSWGYHRDEQSWKTSRELIGMLVKHVSRGGNLLLNVGPTARGYFDGRAVAALESMAAWMRYHARAIYGCTLAPADCPEPEHGRYTYNSATGRLYLHLFAWPQKFLLLPQLRGRVKHAQFLHDGSEVVQFQPPVRAGNMTAATPEDTLTLLLPPVQPPVDLPVIELFLQ